MSVVLIAMRTVDLLASDLARSLELELPSGRFGRGRLYFQGAVTVRGLALIGFRLSTAAGRRSEGAGALIKQLTHAFTGAEFHYRAQIGPGLRLLHPTGVVVAANTRIGARCTLHPCTLGGDPRGAPKLGDDVEIGPGARILGPVEVGDGCRVGANAVMTKTIPGERLVFTGVPARILRSNADGDVSLA